MQDQLVYYKLPQIIYVFKARMAALGAAEIGWAVEAAVPLSSRDS
jgi:hypothetical protein